MLKRGAFEAAHDPSRLAAGNWALDFGQLGFTFKICSPTGLSSVCAEEIRRVFSGDYSLYSQAPARLATMISTRPTMPPTTNRRFGNNPNGIWPRVGSAYPTTQ